MNVQTALSGLLIAGLVIDLYSRMHNLPPITDPHTNTTRENQPATGNDSTAENVDDFLYYLFGVLTYNMAAVVFGLGHTCKTKNETNIERKNIQAGIRNILLTLSFSPGVLKDNTDFYSAADTIQNYQLKFIMKILLVIAPGMLMGLVYSKSSTKITSEPDNSTPTASTEDYNSSDNHTLKTKLLHGGAKEVDNNSEDKGVGVQATHSQL